MMICHHVKTVQKLHTHVSITITLVGIGVSQPQLNAETKDALFCSLWHSLKKCLEHKGNIVFNHISTQFL